MCCRCPNVNLKGKYYTFELPYLLDHIIVYPKRKIKIYGFNK